MSTRVYDHTIMIIRIDYSNRELEDCGMVVF